MKNVLFEGVRIGFRNFTGKEGKYNREGDRNFCVFLETDVSEAMLADGWNVKWLKARNEEEEPQAYLQVTVNFNGRPPRLVMITSRGKTPLGPGEAGILDWADLTNVDLIVRPYEWEVNGKTGVKAYLASAFVSIFEDELELKYGDVPDSAMNSMRYEEDDD